MKRNKNGISLITLVITIVIMIILAGAIILTLSNSNIFDKANEAVGAYDIKQAQTLADTIWAEAYLDPKITTDEEYSKYVIDELAKNNITTKKYSIEADKNGVTIGAPDITKPEVKVVANSTTVGTGETIVYVVTASDNKKIETIEITGADITLNGFTANKQITKEGNVITITLTNVQGEIGSGKTITIKAGVAKDAAGNESVAVTSQELTLEKIERTLGSVITPLDFGKSINYDSGTVATGWKVFYKTDKYVYIISTEVDGTNKSLKGVSTSSLFEDCDNFILSKVIDQEVTVTVDLNTAREKWLVNLDAFLGDNISGVHASHLLHEPYWVNLKNTEKYKDENGGTYVLGAIGSPTLEMFAASWNEKRKATIESGEEDIYEHDIVLTKNETGGYYEVTGTTLTTLDPLYVPDFPEGADSGNGINSIFDVMLATPSPLQGTGGGFSVLSGMSWSVGGIGTHRFFKEASIQPVVCLSVDMPVQIDADGNYII